MRRGSHPHNLLHQLPRRLVVEKLTKPVQTGRVRSGTFVRGREGTAAELTQEPVAGQITAEMEESQPSHSTESTLNRPISWPPAAWDNKE